VDEDDAEEEAPEAANGGRRGGQLGGTVSGGLGDDEDEELDADYVKRVAREHARRKVRAPAAGAAGVPCLQPTTRPCRSLLMPRIGVRGWLPIACMGCMVRSYVPGMHGQRAADEAMPEMMSMRLRSGSLAALHVLPSFRRRGRRA